MEAQAIRTDELHNHTGSEIELAGGKWVTLVWVQKSHRWQGWEIKVRTADGLRVLQSCFGETSFMVRSEHWAYSCSGDAAMWINENVGLD